MPLFTASVISLHFLYAPSLLLCIASPLSARYEGRRGRGGWIGGVLVEHSLAAYFVQMNRIVCEPRSLDQKDKIIIVGGQTHKRHQ